MESEPNTENVSYIDEYPHLSEKIRLRRLAERKVGERATTQLIILPTPINMGEMFDDGA